MTDIDKKVFKLYEENPRDLEISMKLMFLNTLCEWDSDSILNKEKTSKILEECYDKAIDSDSFNFEIDYILDETLGENGIQL